VCVYIAHDYIDSTKKQCAHTAIENAVHFFYYLFHELNGIPFPAFEFHQISTTLYSNVIDANEFYSIDIVLNS